MFETGAERIDRLVKDGPVSRSGAYKAIADGRLKARKFDGTTLILEEDWKAFLSSLPLMDSRSRAAVPADAA